MAYNIEVRVKLKKGMVDAEGDTVRKALNLLGYRVGSVDTEKIFVLSVDAASKDTALREADNACKRLLANPVIHDYSITAV